MGHDLTDYKSAIAALFARTDSGTKFGLERTRELLTFLGNPERQFRSVHVAGTNGKGSVVASCDAILRAKGLRVGRYTSPHLIDFSERVLVNGGPIPEENILGFLERTASIAEKIGATFFELTTALAFEHFAGSAVDVAVIETGMGGRLDSTNVLDPEVATVSSIGLDHTELLGSTVEAIAREKAGIFKANAPAVIGESDSSIVALLSEAAAAARADPIVVVDDKYRISGVRASLDGTEFTLDSGLGSRKMHTRLIGEHQARNATIAVATVASLSSDLQPDEHEVVRGLTTVFLPGRLQLHEKFIFDVAHNPAAAAVLAATIAAVNPPRPRTAVLAVLSDKEWRGVLDALGPVLDSMIITVAPGAPPERAWNPEEAVAHARLRGFAARVELDFDRALDSSANEAATVLVTGSFYTVGTAMSRLQVSPFAA